VAEQKRESIYGFTLSDLREYLLSEGFAKYAADQIYRWIYRHQIFDLEGWSNVSKKIKEHASSNWSMLLPSVIRTQISNDGTVKFLLQLDDQKSVEAVAIPAKDRLTLCLSTQVGCAIGCTFCHTATQGFERNLTTAEMVGQLLAVNQWLIQNSGESESVRLISNIVYMGQGEPLQNLVQVKKATTIFLEPVGPAISQRKITLSTSGLVPGIKQLVDFPPVNIALSLHSPFDEVRSQLMPINQTHSLSEILQAIKLLPLKAHRSITYEYLLIKDLNDRMEDVRELVRILDRTTSKINLIRYNQFPGSRYQAPTSDQLVWFRDQLLSRGLVCTIRQSKGDDIMAACGQLKSATKEVVKDGEIGEQ
jgi:23S rRNA (adenine2503-C2)-methyltransferase